MGNKYGMGGICGLNGGVDTGTLGAMTADAIIANCVNNGKVTVQGYKDGASEIGGICGRNNAGTTHKSMVVNCFSTAVMSYPVADTVPVPVISYCGGVVGYNWENADNGKAIVSNCYYDTTVKNTLATAAVGSTNFQHVTDTLGMTSAQMKAASGAVLDTGVADNKPLVDLLNGYKDGSSYPTGWKKWEVADGNYPTFTAETHDLTVTDGTDPAIEGTKDDHDNADYYWDGNDLVLVFNENTVLDVSGTSETESVIVASEQYATGAGVVCLVNASFVDLTIKAGKVAVVDGSYEDGSIALRNFTLIWGEITGAELTATGTLTISDENHYLKTKSYAGDPMTSKQLLPKTSGGTFTVKALELIYVPDNFDIFTSDEYNLGEEIVVNTPNALFYKDKSVCKIGRNFKLTVFSTTDGGATWTAVTGEDLKDGLPYKVGDYKAKLEAQLEAPYVAFAEDYFSIVAAPAALLEDAFVGKKVPANEYIEVDDTTVPGTCIVKLLKNITMSDDDERFVIPSGKDFILDLNNCTLDRGLKNETSAVEKGNIFTVNGKLTIRDTSGTKNGKLTGATSAYGAAIISNGETVLESGSITDCKALSEDYDTANSKFGRGGAIYVPAGGKFTMTGGEIKNCSASVAGGAIFNCGTVTITDGKIDGCSVSGLDDGSGTVKAKGGAVYNFATSNFTMTGGEISGNTLGDVADMRGAGVYSASGANITLGGTAKITGNTNGKGKANNLFLYEGNTFAVSTDVPPTAMNIGVNSNAEPTEDSPVKLADLASDCSSFFRSDLTGYSMVYTDDALYLCVKTADPCVYNKKADSIEDGKVYNLYLGGKDAGWYTLIKVDGGWKICKSAEPGMVGVIRYPYLAMKDGKLIYTDSENATVWTYKNGAFSTTVKTTQKTNGYWILFFYIPGNTKTVTTTYYLSTVKENEKLSTCSVKAELYEEVTGEHDFGYWIDGKDGTHKRVCQNCGEVEIEAHDYDEATHKCVCGAYDPEYQSLNVTATYASKTQKQFSGFLFWGTWKSVTTYTATVKVETTGLKVKKVEVSANENCGWTKSNTYTSNEPIEKFYARVTTSDGNTQLYLIRDGIAYPAN